MNPTDVIRNNATIDIEMMDTIGYDLLRGPQTGEILGFVDNYRKPTPSPEYRSPSTREADAWWALSKLSNTGWGAYQLNYLAESRVHFQIKWSSWMTMPGGTVNAAGRTIMELVVRLFARKCVVRKRAEKHFASPDDMKDI